jgi:hypothetical protein
VFWLSRDHLSARVLFDSALIGVGAPLDWPARETQLSVEPPERASDCYQRVACSGAGGTKPASARRSTSASGTRIAFAPIFVNPSFRLRIQARIVDGLRPKRSAA